jgi:hypothetical protein
MTTSTLRPRRSKKPLSDAKSRGNPSWHRTPWPSSLTTPAVPIRI